MLLFKVCKYVDEDAYDRYVKDDVDGDKYKHDLF